MALRSWPILDVSRAFFTRALNGSLRWFHR